MTSQAAPLPSGGFDGLEELPRDMLAVDAGRKLGVGEFGEVWFGRLTTPVGPVLDVAVKTCKGERMTNQAFLHEGRKLQKLQHPHIVKVHGMCTVPPEEPVMLVCEFIPNGSLLDFLGSKKGKSLSLRKQAAILRDVVSGMAFLESKHWVHADLAARNCLVVDESQREKESGLRGPQVKICDFGHAIMTDSINSPVRNMIQVPVRWAAPEFYDTKMCCPATDVWSFGVLSYEVMTLAGNLPYAEMDAVGSGFDNKTLIRMLHAGYRLSKTKSTPVFFYHMMLDCWQQAATKRPTFQELLVILQPIATSSKLKEANEDELIAAGGTKFGSWPWCGPDYEPLDRQWAEIAGPTIHVSPCGWRSEKGICKAPHLPGRKNCGRHGCPMPGCDNGKSSGDKMCKSCDTAASGHGSNLSARRATADPMASNPFVGGGGAPDRRNPMLGTRHKSAPAPTGKKKTRTPNKPANKPAPAPALAPAFHAAPAFHEAAETQKARPPRLSGVAIGKTVTLTKPGGRRGSVDTQLDLRGTTMDPMHDKDEFMTKASEATNFLLGLSTTNPNAEKVIAIMTAGNPQPAAAVAAAGHGPSSPGELKPPTVTAAAGGKTSPLQVRKQQLMAEKSGAAKRRPSRPNRPSGRRSSEDGALNNPFAETPVAPVTSAPVTPTSALANSPESKEHASADQAGASTSPMPALDKAARPPKPPLPSTATLSAIGLSPPTTPPAPPESAKVPPPKPLAPPTNALSRRKSSGATHMGADIAMFNAGNAKKAETTQRRRAPSGRRRSSRNQPTPPPGSAAPRRPAPQSDTSPAIPTGGVDGPPEATSPPVAMPSVGVGPLTIDGVDLPDMMYHNFEPPPDATAAAVAVDAESEPKPDPATLAAGRPTVAHVRDGPITVDGIDLPDMMYHNFDPPSLSALEPPDQDLHEAPASAAAADVSSEGYARPLELTVVDSLPPGSSTGDPPALPAGEGSDIGSEYDTDGSEQYESETDL